MIDAQELNCLVIKSKDIAVNLNMLKTDRAFYVLINLLAVRNTEGKSVEKRNFCTPLFNRKVLKFKAALFVFCV